VPLSSFNFDSVSDKRVAEEWPSGFGDEDFSQDASDVQTQQLTADEVQNLAAQVSEPGDSFEKDGEREQTIRENEKQETWEPTPAEVTQGVEKLGAAVEQLGLNDLAAAQQPVAKTRIPAAPVTCERICGST